MKPRKIIPLGEVISATESNTLTNIRRDLRQVISEAGISIENAFTHRDGIVIELMLVVDDDGLLVEVQPASTQGNLIGDHMHAIYSLCIQKVLLEKPSFLYVQSSQGIEIETQVISECQLRFPGVTTTSGARLNYRVY